MKAMRLIGNITQKLITENNFTPQDICNLLGCSLMQYERFIKGRALLSFSQLKAVANLLQVPVKTLLDGDKEYYEKTVVHCEKPFTNPDNREMILDLIDDYIDLLS